MLSTLVGTGTTSNWGEFKHRQDYIYNSYAWRIGKAPRVDPNQF